MTVPFALSVHTFIKDVGADAGFASIIGLALLVLLYFAQMRETRTLRDQLEETSGRVGHLENRLAHLSRVQGTYGVQPPVAPAPSIAVRPMGSAIAALRRTTASAVAGGTGMPAGAPMGLAGPALMSATKLIPTTVPEPAAPGAIPSAAPAQAPPSIPAATPAPAPGPAVAPDPTPAGAPNWAPVPAPAVSSPAAAPSPVAAPLSSPAVVGATTTEDTVLVAPSTAAGGNGHATVSLGEAEPPVAALSPPRRPVREPPARTPRRVAPPPHGLAAGRSRGRRIASVVVVAAGIIAVAVAAVIVLSRSTSPPKTIAVKHHSHRKAVTHRHHPATTFNPANVTVAVLNGTAINLLAEDVGSKLSAGGYKVPKDTIANAAIQTQATTIVSYQRGHAADADQVAKALGLSPTAVQAADTTTLQSCDNAPSATGTTTATATCPADVIVTVGTDLGSLAQNTGTG